MYADLLKEFYDPENGVPLQDINQIPTFSTFFSKFSSNFRWDLRSFFKPKWDSPYRLLVLSLCYQYWPLASYPNSTNDSSLIYQKIRPKRINRQQSRSKRPFSSLWLRKQLPFYSLRRISSRCEHWLDLSPWPAFWDSEVFSVPTGSFIKESYSRQLQSFAYWSRKWPFSLQKLLGGQQILGFFLRKSDG